MINEYLEFFNVKQHEFDATIKQAYGDMQSDIQEEDSAWIELLMLDG